MLHCLITAHGADQGVVLAGAAAAADRDGVVRLALPSEHGAWATLPEITPAPAGRWLVAPSRRAPVGPSGDPAGSADGVGSKSEEVATQLRDLSPGHCDLWPLGDGAGGPGAQARRDVGAVDVALFVNGIPVADAELKNSLTGQHVADAMRQYRHERHPDDVLLRYRSVVHFAWTPPA